MNKIFAFLACAFFVANLATVHSKPPEFIGKFNAQMKARFEAAFSTVEEINGAEAGWEAEFYPRFAQMSPEERRAMNGLKFGEKKILFKNHPETPMQIRHEDLPEEFDPRKRWPECAEVFANIRDQSRCGDCWAVAAAGALSDRICIHSKGKMRLSISDIDVASCAASQANEANDGCTGAKNLLPAWNYFHQNGAVTGSNYKEQTGCKPYPFLPAKEAKVDYHTPECAKKCTNEKYEKEYEQDKIRVGQPISLYSEDWKKVEHLIKQEVFVNGSVEVGFMVYADFYYYSKGIYKQTSRKEEGGHAVRLVGWGTDNGTPYWLIANSWGPEWGENGFFRIKRGSNEAHIEEMTVPYAGMPILAKGGGEADGRE